MCKLTISLINSAWHFSVRVPPFHEGEWSGPSDKSVDVQTTVCMVTMVKSIQYSDTIDMQNRVMKC